MIESYDIDQIKFNKLTEKHRNNCVVLRKIYSDEKSVDDVYEILSDQIGEISVYGQVYTTCLNKNCDYVAKYQHGEEGLEEAKIQYELARIGICPKIKQVLQCQKGVYIIMDGLKQTLRSSITTLSRTQQDQLNDKFQDILHQLKYPNIQEYYSYEQFFLTRRHIFRNGNNYKNYNRVRDKLADLKITVPDTDEVREFRVSLFFQMFVLLEKMHEQGYAHNDCHFNNFMLDQEKRLFLIDFGKSARSAKFTKDYDIIDNHIRQLVEEEIYGNLTYLFEFCQRNRPLRWRSS